MQIRSTLLVAALAFAGHASAGSITVPGTSDMWLAGAADGTWASGGTDSAPAQSPVLVSVTAGTMLTFTVTGMVSNGPCCSLVGPDGVGFYSHNAGAENGISNAYVPLNALLGVFLDSSIPGGPAPGPINFSGPGGLDFLTLAPGLNQVFFIGDGLTSASVLQQFVVPTGATRLFLGTMDGTEWNNNLGSYTVTVAVPEPETYAMMLAGLGVLGAVRRRRA